MAREHIRECKKGKSLTETVGCSTWALLGGLCVGCQDYKCHEPCPACIEQATTRAIKEALEDKKARELLEDELGEFGTSQDIVLWEDVEVVFEEYGV